MQAYRKLALLRHPDKNPDNPNAASEFAALQKAYDLLTDANARAALDSLLQAKAAQYEKVAVRDEKRRRMVEDLERREKAADGHRSTEELARARLHAEIERLKAQAREREARRAEELRRALRPTAPALEVQERLSRTLKVSWLCEAGDYTATDLKNVFSVHGPVADVIMRESKKKSKGSALVVMATEQGADAACRVVNGKLFNPLLVVPVNMSSVEDLNLGGGGKTLGTETEGNRRERHHHAEPLHKQTLKKLGPKPSKPLFPAGAHVFGKAFLSPTAAAAVSGFSYGNKG